MASKAREWPQNRPERDRAGRQELGPGHPAGVGPVERQQLRQPPTRPELAAGEGVPGCRIPQGEIPAGFPHVDIKGFQLDNKAQG